jgi:antitoxin MazE6
MKVAVSLPDDVFANAELLAQRKHMSRSGLYTAALREYLARHEPNAVTTALNALFDSEPSKQDPDLARAARRALERTEW